MSTVRTPTSHSLLLILGMAAVATPGSLAAQGLTIVNNGGSVGDARHVAFFEPFTAATGIPMAEDTFNQKLARIRSQVEPGNLIWDVASVTAINDATGCEEGLFEPVDWSVHLDPADFEGVGGLGACGVPSSFVSGGPVYDGDVFGPDDTPTSWADFWDVERFPGQAVSTAATPSP